MLKKYILFTIGFLVVVFACQRTLTYTPIAEKYELDYKIDRLENEIVNYEKVDAAIGLDKLQGQVLFYGSSSIRLWKTLKEDFAPLPVINHGFGASTFPEMIHYAERMIVPYKPKVLVLYCENDLFMGKLQKSPEQVMDVFGELATLIQNRLPKTKVFYISMKPSISRKADWAKVSKADAMINDYIKKHKNFTYIDIRPAMYRPNGSINGDYFVGDSLHMKPSGYAEWTKIIRPILLKNY
jgi:lysophospholipase L1-like esterase